jgi:flagellum-specific peptidoglycan hydrolase FlgJ
MFTGAVIMKTDAMSDLIMETRAILLNPEQDAFHEDSMITMLKRINIRYPHIVIAQSRLETSNWQSNIFYENQNLFGMKQARSRVSLAQGTQNGHAVYSHWRESVLDYAIYQSRYLSQIRSEEQYYQYLSANYAEDTNYVNKIRNIADQYRARL